MVYYRHFLSEDETSFSGDTKILFGQCDSNKKLHLTELMEYCADFVTELYTQRGYDRQFLADNGYVQMVSRSSIHINELPSENQLLTITVREEKPEGFQLMRYYEFKDEKGNVLIQGKSLWVIVNPQTRAVISPAKFKYLSSSNLQTPLENKPGKIKVPEEMFLLGDQKILPSHIDPNGHLTNAKYINFAIDYLPEEYQNKVISDFRLNFIKEIKKGEIMHIFGAFDDASKKIIVVGKHDIPDSEGEMETSFECELFYK